jgi:hypothetical protein
MRAIFFIVAVARRATRPIGSEHGPARAEKFPIEANTSPSLTTSPLNGGTISLARPRSLDSTPATQRKRSPTCRVPLPRPWSSWSMFSGNGVRNDSQQLRDIQDLIAKLDDVNKKLALPVRAAQPAPARDAEPADAPSA